MSTESPRLRFSNLKRIAQSPAHYLASLTASYDSPAMRTGRLVHAAVLGGGDVVVYEGERRGKAWAEFAEAHASAEIVTRAEYDRALPIADAVLSHPIARTYIEGDAIKEVRIDWDLDGRACRSTPDAWSPSRGFVADLKTSQSSEPFRFGRLALAAHYHAQLAFYERAIRAAHGADMGEHVLIAVETSAPYPVTVHRLSRRAIDEGWKLCRAWLERLAVCESANVWPAYTDAIVDLDAEPGLTLAIGGDEVAL